MKPKTLFNLLAASALVLATFASLSTGLSGGILMARQTQAQGPGLQGSDIIQGTPLGTSFTYQGRLTAGGSPATGIYDFEFRLYDDLSTGSQVGSTVTVDDKQVTDGLFAVELDFGAGVFNGDARYLAIGVRPGSSTGAYTPLIPRVTLTAAPYAHFAKTIYRRTVVVSPVGSATDNGTALLNALAGITGASVNNPYLLKIEPGVYDLGTSSLQMKEGVNIEGSGEKTTIITAQGYASMNAGTVMGANSSELRFLSVTNTGGGTNPYAIAIYYDSVNASAKLTHVTASASMGPTNIAIRNENSSPIMTDVTALAGSPYDASVGVWNDNSAPKMTDVYIYVSDSTENLGVYNYNGSAPIMTNATITASGGTIHVGVRNDNAGATIRESVIEANGETNNYGIYNTAPSGGYIVTIDACQVTGSTNTIRNDAGYITYVGASRLELGTVDAGGGTVTCAGCYDGSYTFYPNTCP